VQTCESLKTGAVNANDALLTLSKVIKNLADDSLIKIKDKKEEDYESSTLILTHVEEILTLLVN